MEKRAQPVDTPRERLEGPPLKCQWISPQGSIVCPPSVKDRAPHLSAPPPLKCQYGKALANRLIHNFCG
ncbi:hypothetical protein BI313_23525 (plasmid) [Xanthomonas vesicatoria]|nr:hypothetical protein BI313_23525 [Xanthomonas vesicatoria]